MRLHALDSIGLEPMRTDLMARLEHHRDRHANYERILKKRFPDGTAEGRLDLGNLLLLRLGARHEQMVADFCEEALEALSAMSGKGTVVPLEEGKREGRVETPAPLWRKTSALSAFCHASGPL